MCAIIYIIQQHVTQMNHGSCLFFLSPYIRQPSAKPCSAMPSGWGPLLSSLLLPIHPILKNKGNKQNAYKAIIAPGERRKEEATHNPGEARPTRTRNTPRFIRLHSLSPPLSHPLHPPEGELCASDQPSSSKGRSELLLSSNPVRPWVFPLARVPAPFHISRTRGSQAPQAMAGLFLILAAPLAQVIAALPDRSR